MKLNFFAILGLAVFLFFLGMVESFAGVGTGTQMLVGALVGFTWPFPAITFEDEKQK